MDTRTTRRLLLSCGSDCTTIDIFEHRLKPAPGYTVDDMANVLVGLAFHTGYGNHLIFDPAIGTSIAQEDQLHPVGLFPRGSVIVAPFLRDIHSDQIDITEDGISFYGGTALDLSHALPEGRQLRPARMSDGAIEAIQTLAKNAPLLQVILGAISSRLPIPYDVESLYRERARCEMIAVRAGSLVQSKLSGTMARSQARGDAHSFLNRIFDNWIIRPDLTVAPEFHISTPILDETIAICDQSLIAAGRKLAEAIGKPLSADGINLLSGVAVEGLSTHEQLAVQQAAIRLDDMIEDILPGDLLKPMAQRRKLKREAVSV